MQILPSGTKRNWTKNSRELKKNLIQNSEYHENDEPTSTRSSKKDKVNYAVSEKEDGGYGCDDVNMDDGPYWDILDCNWAVLGSPGLC